MLLDGHEVLLIHRGIAGFSAEERASTITRRLERLAQDDDLPIEALSIRHIKDDGIIYLSDGRDVLLTINERDATASRLRATELADLSLRNLKAALQHYRDARRPGRLLRHSGYAAIASVALVLFSLALLRGSGRLLPSLGRFITAHSRGIQVGRVELMSAETISSLWLEALKLARLLIVLAAVVYWAGFTLRLYPWTRELGEGLRGQFYGSIELALTATAHYLPNVFVVAIIVMAAVYFLKAVKPFFVALHHGQLVIPGFYTDWAMPTYNLLLCLVIALAVVLAIPYLPGFGSPAFHGASVFLGLLLSLGSTSAITNVIGGIILIYTRAFQVGDHIQVGAVVGDIIEKNFLAIRIRTPANQIITIPNSKLLNNDVVNFNISSREFQHSLLLQTSVGLGYDVPWRAAHATLIEAALASADILAEPAPFVLQTSLGDHAITYQLNAHTGNPNRMVFTLSDLHQHIQDSFQQAGIEILSPTYTALRDGSASTIPNANTVANTNTVANHHAGSGPERPC
ncbi:MAG: mechanosensitive ion channel family protein [Cyanobium sp.]